jgi:hypothetical protein
LEQDEGGRSGMYEKKEKNLYVVGCCERGNEQPVSIKFGVLMN